MSPGSALWDMIGFFLKSLSGGHQGGLRLFLSCSEIEQPGAMNDSQDDYPLSIQSKNRSVVAVKDMPILFT
jgi:hypothetical protein